MDTLSMSVAELRRMMVLRQVKQQAISVAHAGRLLALSERQARRLWKRFKQGGPAGPIHGQRGQPGNAAHGALRPMGSSHT